jgi:hypothetical protein
MVNNNDWLKAVKEGDTVFYVYGGFASRTLKPVVVERVTKTQVIINSTKYRMADASEIGSSSRWGNDHISPYNDENKHIFEVQEKRRVVDNQWSELQKIVKPQYISEGKLESVLGIMEQLKKEAMG